MRRARKGAPLVTIAREASSLEGRWARVPDAYADSMRLILGKAGRRVLRP
jgi:hypothetical protein